MYIALNYRKSCFWGKRRFCFPPGLMDTERKQLSMSKSESIKTYSLCLDSQFLGSSLNKANQQERRSEKFLLARQYEEAINCHQKAAEYLLEALETTRNVDTVQLLKLKYDHHKKQPARLQEMQRREKQRKQLMIEMSEKEEDKEDINENNVAVDKSKQHELAHVETNDRYDSMENADSLLHIIKENTNEENGNVTFRISNLFNYFKANPLTSLTSNQTPSELLLTKEKKRSHFEKDKIIHELNVTIMTLVKNLYSCEEENKFLQEKISSLQNELEASRLCRDEHNESTSLHGTLSTLFSTDMVDGNDTTLDDHFQLNSLQPLPEIDLPPMPEI